MVSLIISILITLGTIASDGSTTTTAKKEGAKKPATSTTSPAGVGVGVNGGTSTWENGTH